MDSHELGIRGEAAAARYLDGIGYDILERNWRGSCGEIDIVARDGDRLVFCEVKTRRSLKCGSPLEAVGMRKQRRLLRAARAYIHVHRLAATDVRFDVCGVTPTSFSTARIVHIQGAFSEEAC